MDARSLLFVPATSGAKVAKALASAADGVIVDLEDSVAAEQKHEARGALASIAAAPHDKALWVRVNSFTTEHCYLDIVGAVEAGIDKILLPKVESAEEVRCIDWLLEQLERRVGKGDRTVALMCIVESARGLVAVDSVASASPRVSRLMFGAVDLAADMGIDMDDSAGATDQARFAVSRASRAAGIAPPVDTAYVDMANVQGLEASAGRARGLGFTGKVCIHPAQIDIVNRVYSPSDAEIAFARRVVAAFESAEKDGRAAIAVDGKMVDYPVAIRAMRLLQTVR